MPRKIQVKKKPELKVVFDTNMVFSNTPSFLLNRAVSELIAANSAHPDLTIRWHLPNVVILERQYQMVNAGIELLPHLEKLEALIGHKLGITPDEVSTRVNNAIDKQLKSHQLELIELDVNRVKWNELINNAVRRVPPFDPGKTEKGFRDAIVLESVLQLIEDSPSTPAICRIAVITNDGLVREAALARITGRSNIRILDTLDELQGLINTLVSEVDETYVAEMQEKAEKYFYSKGVATSLYLKQEIHAEISNRFKKQLQAIPDGADRRENKQWFIWTPTFVSKEGQRTYWNTKITVDALAYKTIETSPSVFDFTTPRQETVPTLGPLFTSPPRDSLRITSAFGLIHPELNTTTPSFDSGIFSGISAAAINPSINPSTLALLTHGRGANSEIAVLKGISTFQVTWSATVNTRKQLTSPSIDDIKYIDTQWQPK